MSLESQSAVDIVIKVRTRDFFRFERFFFSARIPI